MRLIVLVRSTHGDPAVARAASLLRDIAAARSASAEVVTFTGARDTELAAIAAGDVVIARPDLRSDDDLAIATQALWDLGRRGVRCLPDAEALVAGSDRLRTFVRFRHANVPTPSTVAICAAGPRLGDIAAFHGRLQAFPCIVKRPVGRGGRGIVRCDGPADLAALLAREETERPEGAVLVQPVVPHESALRVFAAGGRAVAAARIAVEDAAPRGTSEPVAVPPDAARIAVAALEACGLAFGTADFIEFPGGEPTCLGVDAVPPLDPSDTADRAAAAAIVGCALGGAAPPR